MKHALLFLALLAASASSALAEDTFRGKVVGPKGEPVAGVLIELRHAYQESVRAKAQVRTDAKGQFAITKTWLGANLPDWVTSVSLVARDPRGTFAPGSGYFFRDQESSYQREEVIRLSAGVRVRVRVVDEAGAPLKGAIVHALYNAGWVGRSTHDPLTTDASGAVQFGVTALPQTYAAYVPGRQRAKVEATKDSAGKVTLTLKPGLTISGRVLDSQGQALKNAVVGINRGEDTTGLLKPERWLEGRLCLDAYRAHYGTDPFQNDPAGRPRDDYFGPDLSFAITDAEGKFTLEGLDSSKRKLMALHATHATQVLEVAPGAPDLELRLAPGLTITGRALRQDESASIGAVEAATPMGPAIRVAKVQPDGTYLLAGLSNRAYDLRVTDHERQAGSMVTLTGQPLSDCNLGGGASVGGPISGLPPGESLSLTLWLVAKDGKVPSSYRITTFGSSKYEFGGVRPGSYRVVIHEDEVKPHDLLGEVEVKAGQPQTVFPIKVPAAYVAGEKARQRKRLQEMGIDPSILDDIEKRKAERAKPKPKEPEADRALAKRLESLLDGTTDLEVKDVLTVSYISIEKETLEDFRWKGLDAVPGEYGGGITLAAKARSLGRIEHLITFRDDFEFSFTLELLGGSKRSLCAVVLNKKVAVSWGQQICKGKTLKPFKGKPRGMGSLAVEKPLEVKLRARKGTLSVLVNDAVVDQRAFSKDELKRVSFGVILRDAKVNFTGLSLKGTVDRERLPKAKNGKRR